MSTCACLWKGPLNNQTAQQREDIICRVKSDYGAVALRLAKRCGHNVCPAVVVKNV